MKASSLNHKTAFFDKRNVGSLGGVDPTFFVNSPNYREQTTAEGEDTCKLGHHAYRYGLSDLF